MKIAIIGPGALGGLLAALLVEAGEDVRLVDYRPERLEMLRQQGLWLRTTTGKPRRIVITLALSGEAGSADLTILAVKSHQSQAAAPALKSLMASGGLGLTLQNGLGNLEIMAAAVGPERLLAGVAWLGVTRPKEGEIVWAGEGPIDIGIPKDSKVSSKEIDEVATVLGRAGLKCQKHPDIEAVLWEKLLVNVGINPLTALLRVPNGALLDLPDVWPLAVTAAREAEAVAQASGINLVVNPEERLHKVCLLTAANLSSMLQDVLAGRPTEIEALNAQVVARGAALGIDTPVNDFLTRLLRALGQAGQKLPG